MPYLTLLLLSPLVGATIILLLPKHKGRLVRQVALIQAFLTMLFAWGLLALFRQGVPGQQLSELVSWNPRLGTTYALGVDGFSFPLILLATLLCLIAVIASAGIRERIKGYYFFMLLLESAMLGVFMAQDWSLFYVFWEFTLIPLFFLIDRWGGKKRSMASLNFVLYTMGGSVFMLLSLLLVFDNIAGQTFNMAGMAVGARLLSPETQVVIFFGFLIGFGVKMPIFPIHGWLPLAHVEAPSPVSILLSGILLKMGSYGLIRVAIMLPEALVALQGLLAGIALFSLVYGGLLAWRQSDLKAMIAYSSVSHMGVVLLGIASLNEAGLTGAVMQMVGHGLVAGVLFLLIGLLYERTQTREVSHYSSLVQVTPRFAFFTTLALVAAMGLPGTAGFVAEFHALVGGFQRWGWFAALLTLGVLISAVYAIRTIGRLFTGPVRDEMREVQDLRNSEMLAAGLLTAGILILGILPAAILELMSASIVQFATDFRGYF